MSLSPRFPLRHSSREIRSRLRRVVCLGQHDPIDDRVQSTVAASVQPVPDTHARGCLEWSHAGVGSELRITRKALARAQEAGKDARGEGVHTAEASEGRKSRGGEFLDLQTDVVNVLLQQLEANRQPAYGRSPVLLERPFVRRRVPGERFERATCD